MGGGEATYEEKMDQQKVEKDSRRLTGWWAGMEGYTQMYT